MGNWQMLGIILERLEASAERLPFSGCWVWTGSLRTNGYGQFKIGGESFTAHRASWLVHHGEIPAGLYVCHHCDVRCCINPAHLFLGTAKDNRRDAIRKGRARFNLPPGGAGTKNAHARLAEEDVRAIHDSQLPDVELARSYRITPTHVGRIKAGRAWGHLWR